MSVKLQQSNYNYLIIREIFASFFFTLGLFSILSLFVYSSSSGIDLKGSVGNVGIFISYHLGKYFGISSFIFPVIMIYTSFIVFKNREFTDLVRKFVAAFLFMFSIICLLGLLFKEESFMGFLPAGGFMGFYISKFLVEHIAGNIGSYLIVTISIILSLIILINLTINDFFGFIEKSIMLTIKYSKIGMINLYNTIYSSITNTEDSQNTYKSYNDLHSRFDLNEVVSDPFNPQYIDTLPQIVLENNFSSPYNKRTKITQTSTDYNLPHIDLLDIKENNIVEIDKESIYEISRLIEEKLNDFGVTGKVTEIRPGPVITMFEYKPSPGIKINKIASLSSDLAMGLSALSIRIIAPIPGKDVVGIEVPNNIREEVSIRELLEDRVYINHESKLTIALGKDISGMPIYMDLGKAPHLMIAGTTGSGKSVFLHTVITSMLFKATPSDLKLLMIDPKMLELSVYENLPHLLHPVVINPKEAVAALKWAVNEMELRYNLLSEEGVRDIETYNKKFKSNEYISNNKPLPYIVIIIDELADLMMVAPGDIKESITRLSQMARAAGIHLIVATQRPSADVVAGLIKANFPARISFLVSSKIDSRIILDAQGAEQLLGKGDMLYLQPGTSNLIRVQGALISDEESKKVTKYLKDQAEPEYNTEVILMHQSSEAENLDDEKDELYIQALKTISESGQASISMLQRRLRIGYNRAARIIDIMEKEGFIGQQETAGKPREVYIDSNTLKEIVN